MRLGCRFLLLALAIGALQGCFFVARSPGPAPAPARNVIVYSVNSAPPPRPVGWRRGYQFHYYPDYQVYYAPHRNCYIWKGPRGWMTTPQPPPNVVLIKADALNVEIENDDPAACHAEVEARVKPIAAKSQRRKRVVEASPRQANRTADPVKVEVNVTVEDEGHDDDQVTVEVKDDVKAEAEVTIEVKEKDKDKVKDKVKDEPKADASKDESADSSSSNGKGQGQDNAKGKGKGKAKGNGKGKGKGKGNDEDENDG